MKETVKILVVEDEYITAKTLSNFLENSGYKVVGCAMDVAEALNYLETEEIDCVILDINLNDKKDGVWVANTIKSKFHIPYIYLTAYTDKETIERAINSSPYGFLAKPFQKVELFTAIEIALHKHNEFSTAHHEEQQSQKPRTLFLKNIDKFEKVAMEDIYVVESQKNYLLVQTETKLYKHRATLKEFIELLPKTSFIKTHRAFLVNKTKITAVDKVNSTIRILDKNIPFSKAFKQEVFDKMNFK
jgi:DNA-binding LytR/AlgR family response regulator